MTGTGPTIRAALRRAAEYLSRTSDSPELDAQRLFEHVLNKSTSQLIMTGGHKLSATDDAQLDALIERRHQGEPLAYITGRVGFWTLELAIAPPLLVPRPDTETLVATALDRLPANSPLTIADLGTGCGAIALALASERPAWTVMASDQCDIAVSVAGANRDRLGLNNVETCHGDWFAPFIGQRFDAIVSNPPYIAPDDCHLQNPTLGYESANALVAADHGLAAIRRIATGARQHLKPGGTLFLEHGAEQASAVQAILAQNHFSTIETHCDLAGRDRVTLGISR